jgi:hypothetical protein
MNAALSRHLLLLSIAAYAVCLPLTAFCPSARADGCFPSFLVLAIGWLGVLTFHPPNLIWLANPALVIAWVLIAISVRSPQPMRRSALTSSGLALLLAAWFLLPVTVMGMGDGSGLYAEPVGSRGAGYWLWLASTASAFAGALLLPVKNGSGKL